jgi:hypothetical protein
MTRASAALDRDMLAAPALGLRSGTRSKVDSLRAALAIRESQTTAWSAFAATLSANARRLDAVDGTRDHPFGCLQDRLSALGCMREAAAVLLSVLDVAQQQRAQRLLPLCCLPRGCVALKFALHPCESH